MRKTLIEKCEEVINTQKVFINLKEGLDLRTAKLFKDLLQFHTGELSSLDFVLTQDSILYPNTSPNQSASFIPAVSQKNFTGKNSHDLIGKQNHMSIANDDAVG